MKYIKQQQKKINDKKIQFVLYLIFDFLRNSPFLQAFFEFSFSSTISGKTVPLLIKFITKNRGNFLLVKAKPCETVFMEIHKTHLQRRRATKIFYRTVFLRYLFLWPFIQVTITNLHKSADLQRQQQRNRKICRITVYIQQTCPNETFNESKSKKKKLGKTPSFQN